MLATKSNRYTFQKDGVWYFSRRVPGRVFACSNQQVCYRATVNAGHIVKYYSNEVNRRKLVCSSRPLFTVLSKADRSHIQKTLR